MHLMYLYMIFSTLLTDTYKPTNSVPLLKLTLTLKEHSVPFLTLTFQNYLRHAGGGHLYVFL